MDDKKDMLNDAITSQVHFDCDLEYVTNIISGVNVDEAVDLVQEHLDNIASKIESSIDYNNHITYLFEGTAVKFISYICNAIAKTENLSVSQTTYKTVVNDIAVDVGIIVIRWDT